ncbi:hypothetical protein JCM8547_008007 [Rhodosporidiobolus lusitaniae]
MSAPPSLASLRDSLDSLLQDYLDALSDYQRAREQLNSALKDGYFHLARAKLALGPTRVGQNSYDLAEKEAQRVVSIAPATSARIKGDESTTTLLSYTVDTRSPTLLPTAGESSPSPPSSSSQLRQRLVPSSTPFTPSATPPPSSPSEEPPSTPKPSHPPPSPLHQFSAFAPPALRQSASAFEKVTEAAAKVVQAEGRVRDKARGVKKARREVASREVVEGERGGGGE